MICSQAPRRRVKPQNVLMLRCGYLRDPPAGTCLVRSLNESYMQACMCKLAEQIARRISLVSACFSYMLEAHVDAIRKFCSALKSVHRESKGGRDARENMSEEVSEMVEKRRDLRREHQAEVALNLFQLTADYQWIRRAPLKWYWRPNSICPLSDPLKQILRFNFYLLLAPWCCSSLGTARLPLRTRQHSMACRCLTGCHWRQIYQSHILINMWWQLLQDSKINIHRRKHAFAYS